MLYNSLSIIERPQEYKKISKDSYILSRVVVETLSEVVIVRLWSHFRNSVQSHIGMPIDRDLKGCADPLNQYV